MDSKELVNRLKRLEMAHAVTHVHNVELRTLIISIMTSPGQYTTAQIARAFDRLLNHQGEENIRAYDIAHSEYPLPEDTDVTEKLREMGLMPQAVPVEEQLELPFDDLKRLAFDDLDLFGDDAD